MHAMQRTARCSQCRRRARPHTRCHPWPRHALHADCVLMHCILHIKLLQALYSHTCRLHHSRVLRGAAYRGVLSAVLCAVRMFSLPCFQARISLYWWAKTHISSVLGALLGAQRARAVLPWALHGPPMIEVGRDDGAVERRLRGEAGGGRTC